MPYKDPDIGRAYERRRYMKLTAERGALGLCLTCGRHPPAPGLKSCEVCGEKRRKADRARHAKAKLAGKRQGGEDLEVRRRKARATAKRRYLARLAAGTCTRCGKHPPVEGGLACERCGGARRAGEQEQYGTRRATGACGKCGAPATDGGACCARCTKSAAKRARKKTKNARNRRLYVSRRAKRLCVDCAEPSQGAARCLRCARRSWARSGEHRGIPLWPPSYQVIELATGEDHGPCDSWAEVAACLAFAKLSFDEVEVISDAPPMGMFTAPLS